MAEQILVRNLPSGTKAALRARADQNHRSVEAEARAILSEAVRRDPPTIVDLVRAPDGVEIEFEPGRLGVGGRPAEL
ncbi:FitA-like ribbon-helix-helix domain-containing protein [Phycicoccus flavus]|uniref:Arc family DNA-binding protein n=1 Tax=Phycicoccus flavus TaxID=2502783 RepID=A0A8T6R6N1_9MICO|nr:Arc family DNA-binding protein [Phycicoccus flavus]NHA69294.1 Arc family DNA-binding protein [Phycicoccus flavus]